MTSVDYANNRYYSNITGSFMTPDPSRSSGGPSDPQSWNRYAYTAGDPANRMDPAGLDYVACGEGEDGCTNEAYIDFNQGFQGTPPAAATHRSRTATTHASAQMGSPQVPARSVGTVGHPRCLKHRLKRHRANRPKQHMSTII